MNYCYYYYRRILLHFPFSKMKIPNYLLKIRFIVYWVEFNLILPTFSNNFLNNFLINARLFVKNINGSVINRTCYTQCFETYFFSFFFFLSESCTINYKTVCWFHATVQLYCYTIARTGSCFWGWYTGIAIIIWNGIASIKKELLNE